MRQGGQLYRRWEQLESIDTKHQRYAGKFAPGRRYGNRIRICNRLFDRIPVAAHIDIDGDQRLLLGFGGTALTGVHVGELQNRLQQAGTFARTWWPYDEDPWLLIKQLT